MAGCLVDRPSAWHYARMTTTELEHLLSGGTELPALDFKGPCDWTAATFAKDILALGNLPSGGRIVVGVEDKTWARLGITAEQAATYRVDQMRDQMGRFADPHVQFNCETVQDKDGKTYVVIHVQSFQEIPVICAVDDAAAGVHKPVIYYRTSDRRPESAPISNSYDMRTLIEVATARMYQGKRDTGWQPTAGVAEKLDRELGGL